MPQRRPRERVSAMRAAQCPQRPQWMVAEQVVLVALCPFAALSVSLWDALQVCQVAMSTLAGWLPSYSTPL